MTDQKLKQMVVESVTKGLIDKGQLVEAGFMGFKHLVLGRASEAQVEDMRIAFFAGAQHLWGSVMSTMTDPGDDASDTELERMAKIDHELAEFGKKLAFLVQRPKGSG